MESKVIVLGNFYNHGTGYAGNVFDKGGLCPTLTNMQGGGRQPMIICSKKQSKMQSKIICCFAAGASENYGMKPNTKIFKTIKAENHDISILEQVWKNDIL